MAEDQGIKYQIFEDNENEAVFKPIQNLATPKPIQNLATPKPIQNLATPNPIQNLATPKPIQNLATPNPIQNLVMPTFKPPEPETQNKKLESQIQENDISMRIKQYIAEKNPGLTILTPCYGGTAFVTYMESLIQTFSMCKEIGLRMKIHFCKNDSLVSRARNNLIAKAMSDPTTTHMLFIDADITWDPIDIVKLFLADKGIVGGIYPIKNYKWDDVSSDPNFIKSLMERKQNSQLKNIMSDKDFFKTNLVKYNVNYESTTLNVSNNLAKVRHLATGFMMIKRDVIETMSKGFPQTKYTDDVGFLHGEENKYAYALFDCGVEEDHYFSEDWMFCHRWSKMGGGVYIDVTINLDHTGVETFKGSYISSVM